MVIGGMGMANIAGGGGGGGGGEVEVENGEVRD